MAKILITTIQVNFVPNPSEFLLLAYHYSPFLAATFDSQHFFQLGYFGLDIYDLHNQVYSLAMFQLHMSITFGVTTPKWQQQKDQFVQQDMLHR